MKNLFHSLHASPALPAIALAKAALTFTFAKPWQAGAKMAPIIFVFLWLQACSQSPSVNTANQTSHSILSDTTGVSLGDSPSREYRLFKFPRKDGDQNLIDLKLLRLTDLKETLVSTLPAVDTTVKNSVQYPKFYWAKDSEYLITENILADSALNREMVLFDLKNFIVARRVHGNLLNFDPVNDFVFLYRYTPERQVIFFFDVRFPDKEQQREMLAQHSGQLPVIILAPAKREAKVKAYMIGGVPLNFSIAY